MSVAKVAISLDPELLSRLDAQALAAGQSRSAFMRTGLRALLDALEEERTAREARSLYHELEAEPGMQHEAFLAAARETVPPFEPALPDDRPGTGTP